MCASLVKIELDKEQVKRALAALKSIPGGTKKAVNAAVNGALREAKKEAVDMVQSVYTVTKKKITETLHVKPVKANGIGGELVSVGSTVNARNFQHAPQGDTTGRKRKLIRLSVFQGKPKPLGFGFKSSKLNKQLFVRLKQKRGNKKDPNKWVTFEKVDSISVPQMLGNAKVAPKLQERIASLIEEKADEKIKEVLK